ncbi:MAG TPA: hypothetical protein VMH02_13245 [Verrucomicrobiae bacterium]|nr:hypothetical protein [Verrucomicrobiae bacterium]
MAELRTCEIEARSERSGDEAYRSLLAEALEAVARARSVYKIEHVRIESDGKQHRASAKVTLRCDD